MRRRIPAAFAAIVLFTGVAAFSGGIPVASAVAQDTDLVQDGLRLPRSHKYEVYNPGSGTYSAVPVESVPERIRQGAQVYDRTATTWVAHPSVGTPNPQYAAGAGRRVAADGDMQVLDGLRLPRSHKYEVYSYSSSTYSPVTVDSVPGRVRQGQHIYDRTAGAWVAHPTVGNPNPRYAASGAQSSTQSVSGTTQIDGRVLWISDSDNRMTIRTNDGRTINVRMNRIDANTRKNLDVGDRVAITGREAERRADGETIFVADTLTEGARNTAGSEDQQWSRIHGRVESVNDDRTQLRFKADDGRMLNVETQAVSQSVRQALTPGEPATIIGFAGQGNRFDAQYIQQDSSDPSRGGRVGAAPSASPALDRPARQEDCRDNGWSKYRNPVFKNQGECVSWVNRGR